ncbi:MAG: PAS domain-containing protein [Paludibacter sp.]
MENLESVLLRERAEKLLQSRLSEKNIHLSEADALLRIHELEVTQIELELQNDELKRTKEQNEKTRRMIHNIEVQHIELELQNEELQQTRIVLEKSSQKYAELYDFAPTAYFTISKNAEIEELNLTAVILLGKERTRLLNSSFGFFVADESKPIFNHFLDKVFGGLKKETCEIELITDSIKPIYVQLIGRNAGKEDCCLVNVIDITKRKVAEDELKKTKLLLQSSIESQKEMIIISIDKDFNYLYFNQFHKNIMAGLYGNEIQLGMNILENISSNEDRENFKANCNRALSGESHISIDEYGDLKRDFYEARYNPIINDYNEIIGATIFAENISNRILVENQLQDSELFVKNIINTLTAHIVVLDQNGVILAVNEAWKNFSKEKQ